MKWAVSGKGGVGKSTLTAALALLLAETGRKVLAVDADPDANLASFLGIPLAEQAALLTIADQKALIEERTGARVRDYGGMFKLNPTVDDLAGRFAYAHRGVRLLVLGAVRRGGSGCACPENTLLRALVQDLVLNREETLLLDMEAGIEHLGRATVRGVDGLLVVLAPGQRAVEAFHRIRRLAADIGLSRIRAVLNGVRTAEEEAFLRQALPGIDIAGVIPEAAGLRAADRDGMSVLEGLDAATRVALTALRDHLFSQEAST